MKIKLLTLGVLLAVSSTVSAQYYDPINWKTTVYELDGSWSTVWAEFNPSNLVYDISGADDQSVTGVSLGYSQAFNVIPNTGLFLEAGLGMQYTFYNEDESVTYEGYKGKMEEKFSMWSAKIPVNFMYKFAIGNSGFSLSPYAGLTLRYNFSAKIKEEVTIDGESESETIDLFKKSDMGGSDYTWKHFQLGWQVGLKAIIGNTVMIGASYGYDFNEIAKKTKLQTTSISLGVVF